MSERDERDVPLLLEQLRRDGWDDAADLIDKLKAENAELRALAEVVEREEDPVGAFMCDVTNEVIRAREKFPSPAGSMCALTEEVGEAAKALLDEPWAHVYTECVQVAAMAIRVAIEGDPTLYDIRSERGHDTPLAALKALGGEG